MSADPPVQDYPASEPSVIARIKPEELQSNEVRIGPSPSHSMAEELESKPSASPPLDVFRESTLEDSTPRHPLRQAHENLDGPPAATEPLPDVRSLKQAKGSTESSKVGPIPEGAEHRDVTPSQASAYNSDEAATTVSAGVNQGTVNPWTHFKTKGKRKATSSKLRSSSLEKYLRSKPKTNSSALHQTLPTDQTTESSQAGSCAERELPPPRYLSPHSEQLPQPHLSIESPSGSGKAEDIGGDQSLVTDDLATTSHVNREQPSPVQEPRTESQATELERASRGKESPFAGTQASDGVANAETDPSEGYQTAFDVEERSGPPKRRGNRKKFVIAVLVLVFALAAFLIALLSKGSPYSSENRARLCTTRACAHYRQLILQKVSKSLDPCEDFSAFACSAWTPDIERGRFETSSMASILASWIDGYEELLSKGTQSVPVVQVALRMYRSCVSRSGVSLTALREIMRKMGIPWPAPPKGDKSPLRVLLEAAYRYKVDIWFAIRFLPRYTLGGVRSPFIHLSTSDSIIASFQDHQMLVASNTYDTYWRHFYSDFQEGERLEFPPEDFINETRLMQTFVYETFFNVATGAVADGPRRVAVSSLGVYTRNLSSEEWKTELLETLPVTDITDVDKVSVSDLSLLNAVGAIFATYTREKILDHLGWHVAQHYGPLADFRLMRVKYGDDNATRRILPAVCAREVDGLFRGLAATVLLSPNITEELHGVLRNIVNTTYSMIEEATWLENSIKSVVRNKFYGMRTLLRPNSKLFQDTSVTAIYINFTQSATSMFQYILGSTAASDAVRKMIFNGRAETISVPNTALLPLFSYDRAMNELSIAASAVQAPMYSEEGTKVMTYAGFGFFFAQHLVHSLDSLGRRVLPSGTIEDTMNASSFGAAFTNALEHRSHCTRTMSDAQFADLVALVVTYAALRRAVFGENELSLEQSFTNEQVFYTGICYLMCRQSGAVGPLFGDCNKAVSNFPPFAKAFGCAGGSKMNPDKKCTIF